MCPVDHADEITLSEAIDMFGLSSIDTNGTIHTVDTHVTVRCGPL